MAENVEHPSDAESDSELEQYDVVDLVERDGVIVIDSEGSDWDSQDDGAVSDPDETTDSERDTDDSSSSDSSSSDSSSSDSELDRSLNLDELDLERDGIIVLDLEDSDSEQEQEQDHVEAQLEETNSESEEDVYPSSFSVWQRICARVLQLRNRKGRRIDWNRSRPYSERRRFR